MWVVAGTKFGSKAENNIMLRKAVYGLKNSGTAFRAFLAKTLGTMGYRPIHANPYLWLHPSVKPDGFEYYEYILCYIDNMMSISRNTQKSMKRIQEDLNVKDNKIESPDVYLGARLIYIVAIIVGPCRHNNM